MWKKEKTVCWCRIMKNIKGERKYGYKICHSTDLAQRFALKAIRRIILWSTLPNFIFQLKRRHHCSQLPKSIQIYSEVLCRSQFHYWKDITEAVPAQAKSQPSPQQIVDSYKTSRELSKYIICPSIHSPSPHHLHLGTSWGRKCYLCI